MRIERPGADELDEVRRRASQYICLWRTRTIYSGIALSLSCASVYPFLAGHRFHTQSTSLGKYLVFLSMVLLPVFLGCAAFWYNGWEALRRIEKGRV